MDSDLTIVDGFTSLTVVPDPGLQRIRLEMVLGADVLSVTLSPDQVLALHAGLQASVASL